MTTPTGPGVFCYVIFCDISVDAWLLKLIPVMVNKNMGKGFFSGFSGTKSGFGPGA